MNLSNKSMVLRLSTFALALLLTCNNLIFASNDDEVDSPSIATNIEDNQGQPSPNSGETSEDNSPETSRSSSRQTSPRKEESPRKKEDKDSSSKASATSKLSKLNSSKVFLTVGGISVLALLAAAIYKLSQERSKS